jgi:hypothetical protein
MNRPHIFYYAIGNPLSALALTGYGGFLIYQWWIGQMSGGAVALAVFVIGTAMNANQKITDYGNWKRSWDAMGGGSGRWFWVWLWIKLHKPIAVLIWFGGAYGLTRLNPHRPETPLAIASFTIGSATIVIAGLYRLWRRFWRRRPRKIVPVAISLQVPRKSPGPRQFNKGMPAYCARLNQG